MNKKQNNSILRKIYNEQQTASKIESKEIFERKGDILQLSKWILVGVLTQSIVLVPLIILYARQENPTTTTLTTTPFLLRWNTTGRIVAGTGSPGSNSNELNFPYGLGLDSSNALYVVDRSNNRVQKYQPGSLNGTTVAGQSPTTFNEPGYLAFDSNNGFYVSDCVHHRVQYWASGATQGVTVAGTGSSGSTSITLNTPRGVAFNPSVKGLYVADMNNDRVMYYIHGNLTGVIVAGGNGCGSSATQLCGPVGVQFDSVSNSLFIVNYNSHTFVRWVLGAAAWTLIAGAHNNPGTSPTLLKNPASLVLDPMGNMYVADTGNHRIILFMKGQTNGTTIAGEAGTSGSSLSHLNDPFWVSLDTQYNLYVSDRDNHRVIKFFRY